MASEHTYKVNVDWTNAQQALKDIVGSLDRLNKKLDEMGTKTQTRVRKTTQALSEQQREYQKIGIEIAKLQRQRESLSIKEKQRLSDLIQKQKQLGVEIKKTASTAETGAKRAATAQRAYNNQLSLGTQLMLRLKSVMLTVFGAYAIINGIRNTVNTIKEFELGMARVAAITGATADEMDRLSASARVLATRGIFNPTEIAAVQVQLAKFGFTIDEISASLEGIIKLSTATGEELESSATLVSSSLRALGLSARETQRLVDVLGKSFTSSALDVAKFRESAKFVLPIARQLGWTIEEVSATLAKLADAGISGSLAGTGLRQVFLRLLDPTSDLAQVLGTNIRTFDEFFSALKRVRREGLSFEDFLQTIPIRARTMATVLWNTTLGIEEFNVALEDANGSIDEMANIQLETLSGQLDRLSASFAAAVTSMQSDGGILKEVVSLLADEFERFAKLADPISFALVEASDAVKEFDDGIKDLDKDDKLQEISDKITETEDQIIVLSSGAMNLMEAYEELSIFGEIIFGAGMQLDMKSYGERLAKLREELRLLKQLYEDIRDAGEEDDGEDGGGVTDKDLLRRKRALLEYDKFNMLQRARRLEDEQAREEQILAINKFFEVEKLKLMLEYGDLELEEREAINEKIIELEKSFQFDLQNLREDYIQQRLDADREAAEEQIEIQKEIFAIRIQEMKNAGASEELILLETLKFQAKVLEAQIQIAKAFGATTEEIEELVRALELVTAKIDGISFADDDAEVVKKVEDNTKRMANAYKRLASEIVDSLQTIVDAQVENTTRLVDDLDTRIAEVQRDLERETELYLAGYANNVDARTRELNELKEIREQAIKDREAAIRKQQALEAVSQAIDLAGAVANTIKIYSDIPFVGLALAGVTIAGFLALFASAQKQSRSLTQYGEGGRIDGNSHRNGGVAIEAEGGEFVIKKSQYAKYSSLVEAINADTLPQLDYSTINNINNSKTQDVIVDNRVWHDIKDLLNENLNRKTTNIHGGKKITRSGIKTRTTNA